MSGLRRLTTTKHTGVNCPCGARIPPYSHHECGPVEGDLQARASEVAKELREIAARYRNDWSDFDGRVLRAELTPLADRLEGSDVSGREPR